MRIITRYLAQTTIRMTALALLLLCGVELLVLFLTELRDLGSGHYQLSQIAVVVMMSLPRQVYGLFPMAGLLGSVLGVGFLAERRELIAIRSIGYAPKWIARDVLLAGVLLTFLVMGIGEGLTIQLSRLGHSIKQTAITHGDALATLNGLWLREGARFIHVETVQSDRELKHISIYTLDNEHHLLRVDHADQAQYTGPGMWILNQVQSTVFSGMRALTSHEAHQNLNLKLSPNLLNATSLDPHEMTLLELSRLRRYRDKQHSAQAQESLIFWQRVLQPFASIVMILLGVSLVLGPLERVSIGLRMLVSVLAGFIFYLANQFFGPLGVVRQWPAFLTAILPALLFCLIAVFLLRRAR